MKPRLLPRFLIILFLVLAPILLAAIKAPSFWAVPDRFGGFGFIAKQIHEETSDIDILILGSSTAWTSFDIPLIQEEFLKHGHKVKILNLAVNWAYQDGSYMILNRILEKRKVKLVLWELSRSVDFNANEHPASLYFFNPLKDYAWAKDFGFKFIRSYTAALLLSGPRRLVEFLNSNQHRQRADDGKEMAELTASGGSHLTTKPFFEDALMKGPPTYEVFTPPAPQIPVNQMLFHGEPQDPRWDSWGTTWKKRPELFIVKAKEASQSHGAKFALFFTAQSPTAGYYPGPNLKHAELNPKLVPLLKVTQAGLWQGFDPKNYPRLLQNRGHFNANGAAYVSKVIAPAMINLYETEVLQNAPSP